MRVGWGGGPGRRLRGPELPGVFSGGKSASCWGGRAVVVVVGGRDLRTEARRLGGVMSWEGGGCRGRGCRGEGEGDKSRTQERPGPLDRTHHTRSAGSMGKWGNQDTELEVPMPTFQWRRFRSTTCVPTRVAGHQSQGLQHHQMVQPAPGETARSSGTTGKKMPEHSWPSTATSVLCSSS